MSVIQGDFQGQWVHLGQIPANNICNKYKYQQTS